MSFIWDKKQPEAFQFSNPLVEGRFLERPNRFVAYIEIDGKPVRTHVPDPGRLKELLIPSTTVYVEDFGENTGRKTRYSLLLVHSPDKTTWVSLNTQLPNKVVRQLLQAGCLPAFHNDQLVKPEFTYGQSRFDFLLKSSATGQKHLLEIKSVTLVEADKTALFPDAPTTRGTRHLRELIQAKQQDGYEASVLFVVQRDDAERVCPNSRTDPAFYQAVSDAMAAGVHFHSMAYALSPQGILISCKSLPVILDSRVRSLPGSSS